MLSCDLAKVLDYSKRIGLSERKNNKNSVDGEINSNSEYDDDARRSRILGDWDAINYPKSIQAAALKQAKTNLIEQDRELLKIVGRGSSLFTNEEIENQSSWRTFNPFTYVKAIGNWNDKRQNTVRAKGSERWRRASSSGGRFLNTLAEETNNDYDENDLMSSCSKSDRQADTSQKWGPYSVVGNKTICQSCLILSCFSKIDTSSCLVSCLVFVLSLKKTRVLLFSVAKLAKSR